MRESKQRTLESIENREALADAYPDMVDRAYAVLVRAHFPQDLRAEAEALVASLGLWPYVTHLILAIYFAKAMNQAIPALWPSDAPRLPKWREKDGWNEQPVRPFTLRFSTRPNETVTAVQERLTRMYDKAMRALEHQADVHRDRFTRPGSRGPRRDTRYVERNVAWFYRVRVKAQPDSIPALVREYVAASADRGVYVEPKADGVVRKGIQWAQDVLALPDRVSAP